MITLEYTLLGGVSKHNISTPILFDIPFYSFINTIPFG
jgi:hypothetical protein